METTEKCYCLEMFRKTNPDAQGECLKMQCGRYKIEKLKEENGGKPISMKELRKELLRRKKANQSSW
ncbi:hypothetical protein [Bacillus benzoevorans]|uniref:Uncharacterized protein n=1 Tax=Bacillus benzoevorans TaxID=1456 RepID=A0A7X0LVF7_9BACI|nr:hypothetical protein [Bacillus benzoevorans]MBB6445573.1 hypothetical protein [Bacillus benzoevorans]